MLLIQDFKQVKLLVLIQKQRITTMKGPFFETVDEVYIPIAKNSFSESEEYLGMYGIAKITLGYFFTVPNHVSNATAEQGQ